MLTQTTTAWAFIEAAEREACQATALSRLAEARAPFQLSLR